MDNFIHITGAHGKDQITGLHQLTQPMSGMTQIGYDFRAGDAIRQILRGNTVYIGFPGGVNGTQNDPVGILKRIGKLIQQRNRAGIGVGLEDTYHTIGLKIAGGLQSGCDLGGVMRIVIIYVGITPVLFELKPAANAIVGTDTCRKRLRGHAQMDGNSGRGQCIQQMHRA